MPELSADAKKELAEAIRIVREDKQFSMLRDLHSRSNATPPETQPPTGTPATQPPPANPPAGNPPTDQPPAVKKDAYWGELLS